MQLESKACLEDVQRAAELILQFTSGKEFDEYENDALLRSAVERQFEIVGEAINRLRKTDSSMITKIPHSLRIIAFRNILVHGYDVVENTIVWDVVQKNLRPLLDHVRQLINADE